VCFVFYKLITRSCKVDPHVSKVGKNGLSIGHCLGLGLLHLGHGGGPPGGFPDGLAVKVAQRDGGATTILASGLVPHPANQNARY
jgi:hypothetical protein